jgi:hypothetical protein
MSHIDVLRAISRALDRESIAYMLTGSFASAYYGSLRSTRDIDLVIDPTPEQLRRLVHSLSADEYYVEEDSALDAHRRKSMFNIIDKRTGWKIDMIIRKARPFSQEEFRRRRLSTVEEMPLHVATAEDVILSKLEWAKLSESQRQIEDAAAVLRMQWGAIDRPYLERWIHELSLETEWGLAARAADLAENI